jgi:hypothetical protein
MDKVKKCRVTFRGDSGLAVWSLRRRGRVQSFHQLRRMSSVLAWPMQMREARCRYLESRPPLLSNDTGSLLFLGSLSADASRSVAGVTKRFFADLFTA